MNIRIELTHRYETEIPYLAIASITIDDVLRIPNFKLVKGKNGLRVAVPKSKWVDNMGNSRYRCVVEMMSHSTYQAILDAVITAYKTHRDVLIQL